MSDGEWREMLEKDSAPEQPPWTRPIQLKKKRPRKRARD
jgi:hypothetical protein